MKTVARFLAPALLAAVLVFAACKDKSPPAAAAPPPVAPAPGRPAVPAPLPDTPRQPSHVILVSLDGTRPDLAQLARMPTLHAMAREGATTWTARSIVPPLTLPAHTSMLTGLTPEVHGVYWNRWIPAFGTLRFPTVLAIAKSNGVSTAMFSAKDKLAYLFPTGSVDVISFPAPDPRDALGTNYFSAHVVATQAAAWFAQHKPRLMFIHMADVDLAGHYYGWPSPEQFAAMAECDAALALLRDGVSRAGVTNAVFFLTADHGGVGLHHGLDQPEDMTIPWIAWGTGVRRGHTITNQVTLPDTAATIAWLLGIPLPTNTTGQPVRAAFQ